MRLADVEVHGFLELRQSHRCRLPTVKASSRYTLTYALVSHISILNNPSPPPPMRPHSPGELTDARLSHMMLPGEARRHSI